MAVDAVSNFRQAVVTTLPTQLDFVRIGLWLSVATSVALLDKTTDTLNLDAFN